MADSHSESAAMTRWPSMVAGHTEQRRESNADARRGALAYASDVLRRDTGHNLRRWAAVAVAACVLVGLAAGARWACKKPKAKRVTSRPTLQRPLGPAVAPEVPVEPEEAPPPAPPPAAIEEIYDDPGGF